MSKNCDVTVTFWIYDQFGAIGKPDVRRMVCDTYIFLNSNILAYKNWKQNQKISNTAFIVLLRVKVLFLPKMLIFYQLNAVISKIKRALVHESIFSKTTYVCTCVAISKFLA